MALQITPPGGEPRPMTTEEQAEVREGIGAGTYSRDETGIPASDMTAAVQASLGKADTAVQPAALAAVQQVANAAQAAADAAQVDADAAGAATAAHSVRSDNPHGVTKGQVGLGNVDNTSDADKPVSAAQASAIAAKYTKPGAGIPASDMTAAVQASLGKADTASQPAAVAAEISAAVAAHAAAADPHPAYLSQAEGDGRYATLAQGAKADTAVQGLAGMQTAFDAGSAEDKAAFRSSVSGGRARLVGGRTGAIGDSHTEYGARSWYHGMCFASGGRLRRIQNAGLSGNDTGQMLARIATALPANLKLDTIFIAGGSNDASHGLTPAQTASNLRGLVDYCDSVNATPVIVIPPPRAQAGIALARDTVLQTARGLGVIAIDPWRAYYTATGDFGAGLTTDGVHVIPSVGNAAGIDAWNQIKGIVTPGDDGLAYNAAGSLGIFPDKFLFPDANSDGLPDEWYVFSTGGLSPTLTCTPAVLPAVGNTFKIQISSGTAGTYIVNRKIIKSAPAGERYAISGRVTTTGYASGCIGTIRLNISGSPSWAVALDSAAYGDDLTDAVFWAEVTNAQNGTELVAQARITASNTSSAGSIALSQVQIWDLADLGVY